MSPLVTVYIPTRNRVSMVRNAINSCLCQTMQDIEIIVVDDASSDGTGDCLQAMASQDARIRYVRNSYPQGAPQARNTAIDLAKGSYVTGLDDDDTFLPDRLERLVEEHRHTNSACVASQDILVTEKGRLVTRKPEVVTIEDLKYYNCLGNQILAPKEIFCRVGGFDSNLVAAQDYDLWLRIVGSFGPARVVAQPLQVISLSNHYERISNSERRGKGIAEFVRKHENLSSPDIRLVQEFLMMPRQDTLHAARTLNAARRAGAPYHVWRKLVWEVLRQFRNNVIDYIGTSRRAA